MPNYDLDHMPRRAPNVSRETMLVFDRLDSIYTRNFNRISFAFESNSPIADNVRLRITFIYSEADPDGIYSIY